MAGVFEGLRVLDLSWGMAGPMTTMFLADNGAEVTRIEPPEGDPFRDQTGYRVWHRGKRSARLDLHSEDGRQTFLALARSADVVVDSFSPGVAARIGVDHQSLIRINPATVTCSITGYGDHPEHRDRPGYDGLVAARTGLLFDQKGAGARPWSTSAAARVRTRSSTGRKGWSAVPTETARCFRGRRGRASVRPTSPPSASPPPSGPGRSPG